MAGQISIEWAWCGLLVLMLTTKDSKTWGVKDTFSTSAVPSGLARKGIRDTLSEAIFGHDNQVRVVSYNVCGFGAGFKDIDPEQVTRVYGQLRTDLSELKADIVCLNEVKRMKLEDPEGNQREDTLEALAEDLEEMEYFFAHANPGYESFGNAILVSKKLQVIHCDSTHLEGGSYVSTPVGKKHIGRGCLAVPSPNFQILPCLLPLSLGTMALFVLKHKQVETSNPGTTLLLSPPNVSLCLYVFEVGIHRPTTHDLEPKPIVA